MKGNLWKCVENVKGGTSNLKKDKSNRDTLILPFHHKSGGSKGRNSYTAIYSALCTKHKKLYVGKTRQPLNGGSTATAQIVHHSDWSDLAQNYNENDCVIRPDLEILVLEQAGGPG